MARITSLSILLEAGGKDFLSELYGQVIDNVEKNTISSALKNRALSGDPTSGSVEAKRFANSQSSPYGTARAAGAGSSVKAKPVVVQINNDKEIVEEIEEKDIRLYGVDGLLTRRSVNHQKTMIRELERAFFNAAATAATALTATATTPQEILEALIQQIETTKNDYVDGVPRDIINVIMTPGEYGKIRNYLDSGANNANVDTTQPEFGMFHGVRIYSSVYLPAGVKQLGMVNESVALPVFSDVYTAEKVPLSQAYAVSLFYYYGVAAVTPDLIVKIVDGA